MFLKLCPPDVAQPVQFTIDSSHLRSLGGAPKIARCCSTRVFYNRFFEFCFFLWEAPRNTRCCSTRVFYNRFFTFAVLGKSSEDYLQSSMLLNPCPLHVAQPVYFAIDSSHVRPFGGAPKTIRCCSTRVFYNRFFTFASPQRNSKDRSMLLKPCILQ